MPAGSPFFTQDAPAWFAPPDDTPEFMYPAWLSCLSWAAGHTPTLKQFERATGTRWLGPRSSIEAMVDKAVGHNPAEDYFSAFVPWFNVWVWGTVEAPVEDDDA